MSIGAFKVEGSCSEFAALNGSDIVFGRNYDSYRYKEYTESYVTRPKDAYSSLGQSDIFIGREDGVNENGLAVAISFVAPAKVEPGVNFALAARCVLDKCASVDEAVKKLSATSFATANNYLLAVGTGKWRSWKHLLKGSELEVQNQTPSAYWPPTISSTPR